MTPDNFETLFLLVMATVLLLGAGAAVLGLLKRKEVDILLGAGIFELGLLLGSLAQAHSPLGFILGAVGGAFLGLRHLDGARKVRSDGLRKELAGREHLAERMLLLHDRLDELRPILRTRNVLLGTTVGTALASASGILFFAGLAASDSILLLLGSLGAFIPAAGVGEYLVARQEANLAEVQLLECEFQSDLLRAPSGSGEIPGVPPEKIRNVSSDEVASQRSSSRKAGG